MRTNETATRTDLYGHSSEERPNPFIHLMTYSTPSSCAFLNCWTSWTTALASSDVNTSFHVHSHIQAYSRRRDARLAWLAGIRSKVLFVKDVLERYRVNQVVRDEAFLFSDLDVVPLGLFSGLLGALVQFDPTQPQWKPTADRPEIVFMEEHQNLRRAGISDWVANSGFYLLRNTKNVRTFFNAWAALITTNRRMNDQVAVNFLLVRKFNSSARLRWATFPKHLVTGQPGQIGRRTIAYHAVNSTSLAGKARLIRDAFSRKTDVPVAPCDPLTYLTARACPQQRSHRSWDVTDVAIKGQRVAD